MTTPAQHVEAAAAVFADGGCRYRVKLEPRQTSLKSLRERLRLYARKAKHNWSFTIVLDEVWISPARPATRPAKLSQRGMKYNRV